MRARRDSSGGVSYDRPSGLEQVRRAVGERRLGLAHRLGDGFIAGEDGHRHGDHGPQAVRVAQHLQGQMQGEAIGIASQGWMPPCMNEFMAFQEMPLKWTCI